MRERFSQKDVSKLTNQKENLNIIWYFSKEILKAIKKLNNWF